MSMVQTWYSLCVYLPNCNEFAVASVPDDINQDLEEISNTNILSLNASKTKFMVFHNYQESMSDDEIPKLVIDGTLMERVKEFDFLRLTLNWNSHWSKIANKISRSLGLMNRLKHLLPFAALKPMYDSRILSHSFTSWNNLLGVRKW